MAPPSSAAFRLRSRPGFTFVELMIVMIIMGLVSAMSIVGLRRATSGNRVKRAARMVSSDLQYAFTLASARREPMRVEWVGDSLLYHITDRRDSVLFTRRMGAGSDVGLRSGEVSFSSDELSVFPNGLAADTLGVVLHQGTDTTRVWLARGGTTRIH